MEIPVGWRGRGSFKPPDGRRLPANNRRTSARPYWAVPFVRPGGSRDNLGPGWWRSPDMRRRRKSGENLSIDQTSPIHLSLSLCLSDSVCLPIFISVSTFFSGIQCSAHYEESVEDAVIKLPLQDGSRLKLSYLRVKTQHEATEHFCRAMFCC